MSPLTRLVLPLGFALLAGCASGPPVPPASRPGAELRGPDLPPVLGATTAAETPPVAVFMKNPEYPAELRRAGIAGVVVLGLHIGTDGSVKDLYVISSPAHELSELAVKAIRQAKFRPAIRNGIPVEAAIRVPITFALTPDRRP